MNQPLIEVNLGQSQHTWSQTSFLSHILWWCMMPWEELPSGDFPDFKCLSFCHSRKMQRLPPRNYPFSYSPQEDFNLGHRFNIHLVDYISNFIMPVPVCGVYHCSTIQVNQNSTSLSMKSAKHSYIATGVLPVKSYLWQSASQKLLKIHYVNNRNLPDCLKRQST